MSKQEARLIADKLLHSKYGGGSHFDSDMCRVLWDDPITAILAYGDECVRQERERIEQALRFIVECTCPRRTDLTDHDEYCQITRLLAAIRALR